jgi:Cft2 family RNA processing exonuclease
MATLEFLGAAGTVTGSKVLLETGGRRVLVDCGLYQGLKELRLRNGEPLPVSPASIEHVILTHAHIDHSGYLPRLFKAGFRGSVYATRATADLPEDFEGDMRRMVMDRNCPLHCGDFRLARTSDESKAINAVAGPVLIISASGMATGGRVLHHLRARVADPRTTVLLVGYQALGTRGRLLQDGARSLKLYGGEVPVRAHIETIHGLSAHADSDGLMRWLRTRRPRRVFVVHGDPGPAAALAERVSSELEWDVTVAAYRARVEIE